MIKHVEPNVFHISGSVWCLKSHIFHILCRLHCHLRNRRRHIPGAVAPVRLGGGFGRWPGGTGPEVGCFFNAGGGRKLCGHLDIIYIYICICFIKDYMIEMFDDS